MRRLIAGLVLVMACSSATEPVSTAVTWRLSTVGGSALPTNVLAATGTSCGSDIRSGDFVLEADGSYTGSKGYGTVVGGVMKCEASYVENGTYTMTATALTLRNVNTSTGFSRDLAISNGSMTETIEGKQYAYRR
jgi:hypothetical protein